MSSHDLTRRDFVADAGKVALGAMIVPRHVLGGPGYQAPSDTMNFAVVGCGGVGAGNAHELAKTENLVAVCDVDLAFAEHNVMEKTKDRDGKERPDGVKLQQQFAKAKRYTDFRQMLEKQKDIDGV